ncbi:MAG: SDR family oxidoreductase [Halobacteriales archaeon]|nr:SDR family oxidoreductase [Halobacteriales archaeon]
MSQSSPLAGSATLVTGASAGIGRETAYALAREGANVALAARREDRLTEYAADIEDTHGVDTLVIPTDVTDADQVQAMIDATVEGFGSLDVLVNNAGIGGIGPIEDASLDEYRTLMAVNCDGMFYATRAAIPHLRESKGNLIYVASFAGEYPRPGNAAYAATKWWTRGLAYSLAGRLGEDDVAVSIVNPTEVRTEIEGSYGDPMEDVFEPGEVTEPEEIAAAIVFAARQTPPNVAAEIDLYRRDKFANF